MIISATIPVYTRLANEITIWTGNILRNSSYTIHYTKKSTKIYYDPDYLDGPEAALLGIVTGYGDLRLQLRANLDPEPPDDPQWIVPAPQRATAEEEEEGRWLGGSRCAPPKPVVYRGITAQTWVSLSTAG